MVTLVILDGFGEKRTLDGNAIKSAGTPNLDKLKKLYPHTTIKASGEAVGLSNGQMGNSEVGHLNLGAGRVILQDLTKINHEIKTGNFYKNKQLLNAMAFAEKNKSNLHLMGLLSDGGVHSHINHLYAILDIAKSFNIPNIYIHAFLDGRDTLRDSGIKFISDLQSKIKGTNACIKTVCGRVYAMDREKRYDRVKLAYDAIVNGKSDNNIKDIEQYLKDSYKGNIFDEFILPAVIGTPAPIENGDSIIFYNFRTDRARELTEAITRQMNFKQFKTKSLKNILFTTMTEYDEAFKEISVIYPPEKIKDNLSAILSKHKKKQFHVTETTKYAHVTFFFNGGIEEPYKGEDRKLIESINEKDYSAHPKMRAPEILEATLDAIAENKYDFILVNFSNADMIGHTGNFEAAKEAISYIDRCAYMIALASLMAGGECIITADHGNAEEMIDKNGNVLTQHTTNPVPFILVSEKKEHVKLIKNGKLANVAPTVLKLLKIAPPKEMDKPMF